jgi:predicted ATPase
MDEYQNLGTVLNRTAFLILFAQACTAAGQLARGMEALNESIELGKRTEERWFEAEAYRMKGELIVHMAAGADLPEDVAGEAEGCFKAALKLARQQKARMLELRAVTSLSRLKQHLGTGQAYAAQLAEIVQWFSEGHDTQDLIQAKTLLQELAD